MACILFYVYSFISSWTCLNTSPGKEGEFSPGLGLKRVLLFTVFCNGKILQFTCRYRM
jgi:hypothetical protein